MASSTDKAQVTRAGTRKVASVAHLTELLSKATSAVVTDYRGLTVRQLEDLRGKLRARGSTTSSSRTPSPGAPPWTRGRATSPRC